MRMMYDIIVFENPRFRPSTSKGEVGVFKKLHFGEYFEKLLLRRPPSPDTWGRWAEQEKKISAFKQKRIREDRPLTYCFFAVIVDVAVVVA